MWVWQDELAVGGIERGERNVALDTIYSLAAALQVPVRELFPGLAPALVPRVELFGPEHRWGSCDDATARLAS